MATYLCASREQTNVINRFFDLQLQAERDYRSRRLTFPQKNALQDKLATALRLKDYAAALDKLEAIRREWGR
jgi:hypothetical protein